MHKTIMDGDAGSFQAKFTAFLQDHLSLFYVPQHQEKVYQALSFMLIYALFDTADHCYDVKMEQDHGLGRCDITTHPQTTDRLVSFVFEIKRVLIHSKNNGKRTLNTAERLKKELNHATDVALGQIETCEYRTGAPLHARTIHKYGIAFAGNFCVVAVRTLRREVDAGGWVVDHITPVSPSHISAMDLVGDDSGKDDMDVDEEM
jgi:hypothetical protein